MRWVSRFLLSVAIALIIAAAGFWIRGYWQFDRCSLNLSSTRQVTIVSHRGYIYFATTKLILSSDPDPYFMIPAGVESVAVERAALDTDQFARKFLIFRWFGAAVSFGGFYCLGIPAWLMLMATATPVVIWNTRGRRRRRAQRRGFAVELRTGQ